MGYILNEMPLIEHGKVLWDHWDLTGSCQGQVTKGHNICYHNVAMRYMFLGQFECRIQLQCSENRIWPSLGQLAKPRSRSGHQRSILKVHMFGQMTHVLGPVLSREYNKGYKRCGRGHPGSQIRSLCVNPKNRCMSLWALAALRTKLIKLATQNLPWMCTI